MTASNAALLQPFTLGKLALKNRIVMAPMTRGRTPGLVPTKENAEYYAARASAGLIITEGTHINTLASGWAQVPGIYTAEQTEGWKKVTDAVHKKGGKIFMQLWHQGRQSHPSYLNGRTPVSASDVPMSSPYYTIDGVKPEVSEPPRPLTLEEIQSTIEDFAQGARNAVAAGFDGVEIHGANGYLLDQFLQERTNKRTDQYGGSIENRSRFTLEVTKAVGDAIGFDKVGVRFAPNGVFGDMGSENYREQFDHVISKVGEMKPVYIHVMDGLGFGAHQYVEKDGRYTLQDVRKLVPKEVAVMGNCGKSVEDGANDIESGAADLMAYGRMFIGNPDFVERVASGAEMRDPPDSKYWYYPHLFKDEWRKGYLDL